MTIQTTADQAAFDAGFITPVFIEGGIEGGEFLIQPGVDRDTRFKAWGLDWQEWTWVRGYNVLIEDLEVVEG